MKKIFLTVTVSALFLLSFCSRQATTGANADNTNNNKNVQTMQTSFVMQAFKSVLLNEATFSCTDKTPYENTNVIHQYDGYLKEIPYNDKPMVTPQFAIVDLDGNNVPEIVLAIEDYNGFIILRYKENKVFGNIVGYRTMYNLKKDGSFWSSSSSVESSIGKMFFINDTFVTNDKIYSLNTFYYLHDIPINKGTWDKYVTSFDEASDVEWHDYSKKAINQWLVENPLSIEMSTASMTANHKRQNYLDSLSYLIKLTYYSQKSQEKLNIHAKSYYDSCNDEMNKMYQMCKKKLSDDTLEKLKKEQQRWKKSLNQRLSKNLSIYHVNSIDELKDKTLYFTYGDMILRRTFSLFNIYYDYHFYD